MLKEKVKLVTIKVHDDDYPRLVEKVRDGDRFWLMSGSDGKMFPVDLVVEGASVTWEHGR